jgi:glucose-1-phosphate adenylyltransferase
VDICGDATRQDAQTKGSDVKDILTLILAGGEGTRLKPLTRDRAKPAVPFGGLYRIIDFTLSNCLNSGLRKVLVLTQFKARSLDRHVHHGWGFLSAQLGEYIEILPPQQRASIGWYAGTADAIYQNIYSIESEKPKYTLILAGDHIYKMNYRDMIDQHIRTGADLTIGCIPAPLAESHHFGVVQTDKDRHVTGFVEKPAITEPMPGDPNHFLASMGIYVFTTETMFDLLIDDAADPASAHDFGKNIIPSMIGNYSVYAYHFRDRNNAVPYWRDVGTIEAYYQANMDLVSISPELNLYDTKWPLRTGLLQLPPPKFVFHSEGPPGIARRGESHESIVCPGCVVSGGRTWRSILAPRVRINSYAQVEDSILFENVNVGRRARVHRCIIDKDVTIPENMEIGFNADADRALGLTVTEDGIVVVPKSHSFEKK